MSLPICDWTVAQAALAPLDHSQREGLCHSLTMKCPPQACVLNTWTPICFMISKAVGTSGCRICLTKAGH